MLCQPPMTLYRVVGLGAFSRLEKEMQYFIAVPACRGFSFLAVHSEPLKRTVVEPSFVRNVVDLHNLSEGRK